MRVHTIMTGTTKILLKLERNGNPCALKEKC